MVQCIFGSERLDLELQCTISLVYNAQWESARPNLDLPKIEAISEVSV